MQYTKIGKDRTVNLAIFPPPIFGPARIGWAQKDSAKKKQIKIVAKLLSVRFR